MSITPGETALTRSGASSRASERASVSAAALVMATPIVPTAILVAATPEKMTNEPPWIHPRGQVLGQHQRPDHLGVERQPDRVPVQVGQAAPGPGRGGGDHVVDRAEPLAEGGDRAFVGQVDALGADPGLAGVGGVQPLLVTAGRDDAGVGVQGGQHDGAGQAARPARPPARSGPSVLQS